MLQLVSLFVITQVLGLYVGNYLIEQGIRTVIVSEDPNAIENGVALIAWIIGFTIILIATIRLVTENILYIILKALESLAIFGSAIIVMLPFNPTDLAAFGLALILVVLRVVVGKSVVLRNTTSIIAAAGAGALIGASVGAIPILVFLLLMAAYDFIAVFKTRHMVELAKSITTKNLSFTFAMPTVEEVVKKGKKELVRGHQFELGTGDMVVPLAFAVSILAEASTKIIFPYGFIPAFGVLAVSLLGIAFTVHKASLKKGTALPALPVQAVLMAVFFIVLKMFGV